MIKNAKQASVAKQTLSELLKDKADYILESNEKEYAKNKFAIESFDGMILELSNEIEVYENLATNSYHCIKNQSIQNLGELLISCRLAQNLSHKVLAKEVGIDQTQIQRYEATDYESASLSRIQEIADALNISLEFKDVEILGKVGDFQLPKNINADGLAEAELFSRENGVIVFSL